MGCVNENINYELADYVQDLAPKKWHDIIDNKLNIPTQMRWIPSGQGEIPDRR